MSDHACKTYLLGGLRTPFGRFGGALAAETPIQLCVASAQALLKKCGVDAEDIDHVVVGNVCPSTSDSLYLGRHLALKVGAKVETPGYSVNRLCGSGIQAIIEAQYLIESKRADLVLVSGVENMSMIPHLTYGARFGTKYGPLKSVDLLLETLTDAHAGCAMGMTAENLAQKFHITRTECDEYAARSHQRADLAYQQGHLQREIAPYQLKKSVLERDEHLRTDISLVEMAKLRPSFLPEGVVTAANASGIVDGAASILICSEKFLKKIKHDPQARLGDHAVVGVAPEIMGIGPSPAIQKLCQQLKIKLADIDLLEINEAFAAQTLACLKDLKLSSEKVNIWGGAIALGHPLGASGVRITMTLAQQLEVQKQKLGVASACIGGGQGIALSLHRD